MKSYNKHIILVFILTIAFSSLLALATDIPIDEEWNDGVKSCLSHLSEDDMILSSRDQKLSWCKKAYNCVLYQKDCDDIIE